MRKKLLNFLDLKSDLDNLDEIHKSITNGVSFRGTNLWILVFAIVVASVGLNTNSTAVIIGAMLISPLMGPINGMGYAIATYDFVLFRRALKNFVFAVTASLVASTIYFFISPISTAHSELLARTSPSIYDVLIALFGGLAGILAISSKHKGNVIPGVAIATALMPPLCTAGFGLATGQLNYFFGAFYLFTINTVFIGISSVLFSQILNFPIRTIIEPVQKRRVNRWITIVITVTLVPSLYFGYLLVEKERFNEKAQQLTSRVGVVKGSYLLRHEVNPTKKNIKLVYGGDNLDETDRLEITRKAFDLQLEDAEIIFEQGFSFNTVSDNINRIDNDLRAELNRLNAEILKTQKEKDSIQSTYTLGKQLLKELRIMYPELSGLTYTNSFEFSARTDSTNVRTDSSGVAIVVLTVSNSQSKRIEKEQLEAWLKARTNSTGNVRVVYNIVASGK